MYRQLPITTLEHVFAEGGVIKASLQHDGDALACDDAAWLHVPDPQPLRVTLSGKPHFFIEQVLQAHPNVVLSMAGPGDLGDVGLAATDFIVFHEGVPDRIPSLPCMFINPGRSSELWTLGKPLENVLVSSLDRESPLMTHVSLENCTIRSAVPLKLKGGQSLFDSFGQTLAAAWSGPDRKVIALSIDLAKTDLPLRTAFPILFSNCLRWGAASATQPRMAFRTGEMVMVPLGKSDTPRLTLPAGEVIETPVHDYQTTVGPFVHVGLYELTMADSPQASHTFAVSLCDAAESDLRTSPEREQQDSILASIGTRGGYPLWTILVLAAVILSLCEWIAYQRRLVE